MTAQPGNAARSALVTGGSRGIGRAVVLEAARRGFDVLFSYRDKRGAHETLQAARATRRRVEAMRAEMADMGSVLDLAREAARWPGLSLLVNNAGVVLGGPLGSVSDDQWSTSFQINVSAPFVLSRELAEVLRRHNGSIVNVSSNGGVAGSALGAPYGTAKAALIGLTMTLAKELAPEVRVNAIAPGCVATDLYDTLAPAARRNFEAAIPLRRVGTAGEIAQVALDIAGWTYATGITVVVDGGVVMG